MSNVVEIKVLSVAFVATVANMITDQMFELDFETIWKFVPGVVSVSYVAWRWVRDIKKIKKE